MQDQQHNIIVIGSANCDMIIEVPRLPAPGETILGGTFTSVQGGKGANQAVAAAKAGGSVKFIARVGDDSFGEEAINCYQTAGIDTNCVIKDPHHPTGVALINVSAEGENSITVASGANAALSPQDVEINQALFTTARVVLMQLETPLDAVELAATLAKQKGCQVILNPAPAAVLSDELLSQVDIITPNETEAALLTGIQADSEANIKAVCAALKAKGVDKVIITLGARGVYHSDIGHVTGFSVPVTDTTAAGDVFNGAFCAALAQGKDQRDAVMFANAAAALSVQKLGAQSSIPSLEEIEQFLVKNSI